MALGIIIGLLISTLLLLIEMRLKPSNRPVQRLEEVLRPLVPTEKATIIKGRTAEKKAEEEEDEKYPWGKPLEYDEA